MADIYTRYEAAEIVDLFDDMLSAKGIRVEDDPCDDRPEDNDTALYGTNYWNLVDRIEYILNEMLSRAGSGSGLVRHKDQIIDAFISSLDYAKAYNGINLASYTYDLLRLNEKVRDRLFDLNTKALCGGNIITGQFGPPSKLSEEERHEA